MGIIKRLLVRTPPLSFGPGLLRICGLQVFRVIFANLFRFRRPPAGELSGLYGQLERDGLAILPDFLPGGEFSEIQKICREALEANKDRSQKVRTLDGKVISDLSVAMKQEKIGKALAQDPRILDMVRAVTGRKVGKKAGVTMWATQLQPGADAEDLAYTSTNYLHPDVHYPSVKVWLTVHDMDRDNGAYHYAKGSHKLNFKRLMLEYKLSLKKDAYGGLTDEEAESYGIRATPVEAKANCLIISNQMGLHKRGYSRDERTRLLLHVDFRYVESWENRLLAMLPTNSIERFRKALVPSSGPQSVER